jgi:hypothetical protein
MTKEISPAEKGLYLALFVVLIASRIPAVFLDGRFWAEDATIYFKNAWESPWPEALFARYAGYLNLTGNAIGLVAERLVAARIVTLGNAPLVTASLALAIQSIPAVILLLDRGPLLNRRIVLLAALLILATPPGAHESWLTGTNCQYHLAFAASLILAFETTTGLAAFVYAGVLLLAPLSGPAAWFLVPLFALRALIERSPGRIGQFTVLSLGVAIAILGFFAPSERTLGISPSLLGAIVLFKQVAVPAIGIPQAERFAEWLAPQFASGSGPLWPLILVVVMFLAALAPTIRRFGTPPFWLLISAAVIALGSYVGALPPKAGLLNVVAGARYQLAPHLMLMLAALFLACDARRLIRGIAAAIVVWFVALQLIYFYRSPSPIFVTGPNWRAEVRLWEQDPRHRIEVWPPGWSMALSPDPGRTR